MGDAQFGVSEDLNCAFHLQQSGQLAASNDHAADAKGSGRKRRRAVYKGIENRGFYTATVRSTRSPVQSDGLWFRKHWLEMVYR